MVRLYNMMVTMMTSKSSGRPLSTPSNILQTLGILSFFPAWRNRPKCFKCEWPFVEADIKMQPQALTWLTLTTKGRIFKTLAFSLFHLQIRLRSVRPCWISLFSAILLFLAGRGKSISPHIKVGFVEFPEKMQYFHGNVQKESPQSTLLLSSGSVWLMRYVAVSEMDST